MNKTAFVNGERNKDSVQVWRKNYGNNNSGTFKRGECYRAQKLS